MVEPTAIITEPAALRIIFQAVADCMIAFSVEHQFIYCFRLISTFITQKCVFADLIVVKNTLVTKWAIGKVSTGFEAFVLHLHVFL